MKSRFLLQMAFVFIFISTLHAQTWTALTSGTTQNLKGVYFTDANTGYAVGGNAVIKTTNGGTSWTTLTTGVVGAVILYQAVRFVDANTGYVVGVNGANGLILKTTDAGATWAQHTSGTIQSLNAFYYLNPNHQYAVGGAGVIVTSPGGSTWSTQTSGTIQPLKGIYFSDFNTGCAVGTTTLIRTTNGGTNWIAATGPSGTWNGLAFVSATMGYAISTEGSIIKTTDGGANWAAQTSGVTSGLYAVSFADANTGYAVGVGQASGSSRINLVLKTTNGGTNWVGQAGLTASVGLAAVYAVNATLAYAVGDAGTIFKTGTSTPILPRNRLSHKQSTVSNVFDLRGRKLSLQNVWHGNLIFPEWSPHLR